MLILHCPWCGDRDQTEFRYGGQAQLIQPTDPQSASDEAWADYLFYRDNPKGLHRETWAHAWGCRQWFEVLRDTVTHEIHAVCKINATPPAPATPPGVPPA